MRLPLVCLLLVGFVLALASCTPNRISGNTSFDLVATSYDHGENFASGTTFVLPDTIAHIADGGETLDTQYDQQILARIRSNLQARGYVADADGDPVDADFVVLAVTAITTVDVSSYWGAWGGWWGGYYPGGSYPYYPGYGGTTIQFTTGSVGWGMFDVNRRDPATGATPVVWMAILNGLLDEGNVPARLDKSIDQAFAQSPYVVTSPSPPAPRP